MPQTVRATRYYIDDEHFCTTRDADVRWPVLEALAAAATLDDARSMIAERAGVRHSALVNQIKTTKARYREFLARHRNQGGAT